MPALELGREGRRHEAFQASCENIGLVPDFGVELRVDSALAAGSGSNLSPSLRSFGSHPSLAALDGSLAVLRSLLKVDLRLDVALDPSAGDSHRRRRVDISDNCFVPNSWFGRRLHVAESLILNRLPLVDAFLSFSHRR